MDTIFDIRVRSLMQRYKTEGVAVWAFLRDAVAAAPAEGLPIDEVSMGVYADFFPIKVEQITKILDYCVAVGLFTRTPNNTLLTGAQPRINSSDEGPARGVGRVNYTADTTVGAPAKPREAACANASISIATVAPQPAVKAAKGGEKRKVEYECYMEGNVCKMRPKGAKIASEKPPYDDSVNTICGIRVNVPLPTATGVPTPEAFDNQNALKMCTHWNKYAMAAAPVEELSRPLATRLAAYYNFYHEQGVNPYEPFLNVCDEANGISLEKGKRGEPPIRLEQALPDMTGEFTDCEAEGLDF